MLNILSGQATANVKAFPVADGVTVIPGQWVMFDSTGKLKIVNAEYDGTKAVFPAYTFNNKQYDNRYLGKLDVVTASSCVLETDQIDSGSTFVEGAAVGVNSSGKLCTTNVAAKRVGFVVKVPKTGVVQFARG